MSSEKLSGFKSLERQNQFIKVYDAILEDWPPHEVRDIATHFGSTRVTVSGPKGAPALVLIAGISSAGAVSWFENIAELTREYRVFALDTIGLAGRSIVSNPPQNKDDYAEWLDEVVSILDLPPVVLVGHGHGGWIAAYFATRHPERVRSLVLLDPADALVQVSKTKLLKAIIPLLFPTKSNLRPILLGSHQSTQISELWVESVFLGMRYFRPAESWLTS